VSLPARERPDLRSRWNALPGRERFLLPNFALGAQHAMANRMETQARHQGRPALHELQRFHDDMGGAVFVRTLQL
jgi:hypothetical protein